MPAQDRNGRLPERERAHLLERAERLREQHVLDPAAVLDEAGELIGLARRDPELRALARHATALARTERLELDEARRQARLALAAAERAGIDRLAAEVRLTLAWLELDRGRAGVSAQHLERAQPLLRGRPAARGRCLRGLLMCANGQLGSAITELTAALPKLRRNKDTRFVANALNGRGIAYTYTDNLRAADADFAKAVELWGELGEHTRVAGSMHNRGFVAVRAGEVPRGLALFEQAERAGLDLRERPEAMVDRAEAMLAAGLNNDARPVLDGVVTALTESGRGTKLAEATLVRAYCAMRQRDFAAARTSSDEAARLFRAQGRSWWVPLAEAVQVRVRWWEGERSAALQRAAQRVAADCRQHGWSTESSSTVITAAQVALERGKVGVARELLGATAALRTRGTADLRAAAWYALALLRQADGDRRGMLAACRAGLRVVDEHASLLGSTELQAYAMRLAKDLAGLATEVAIADGDPSAVLRWTERFRAGALARPAVHPPADPELAAELVTLRSAVAAARATIAAGHPDPTAERRVARQEQVVRRRALTSGARPASRREPLDLGELRLTLDDAALVSMIKDDERLLAISMADGRVELHDLGAWEPLYAELDSLRFAMHRLARGASERVEQAMQSAIHASASTLDKAVLGPLLAVVEDRPLVVVPTGALHALPWAALPSCHGRPVTVAPSVLSWLRAVRVRAAHDGTGTVWVAGPDLAHAEPEVRSLRAAYGGELLTRGDATVDAVLAALDSSAVAHLAAHGHFRSDQPLFSELRLADGPLYVHDLDRLRRGPRLLVLSACEAGLSGVAPGDELMGLTAALLARGTATLVASVVPVPDDRTAEVMAALHSGLRQGLSPSAALAAAQAGENGQLGFVCFGAP